ncbi:UxaA family hydrolase [Acidiplasma cupricumulans]|uniref:D-galactarate dehydratase n=2 Tax=Acidiplasma cupricumulans TaxID=312540 RepID=A0A0Q0VRD0_9ARCH|nr:UxaA family hydrolase [Acidiplasma cupricumulans]KQB33743.1 D-galactarate dehydratase [Acidiplasma cupricumulans]
MGGKIALIIDKKDNVATVLNNIKKGDTIMLRGLNLDDQIISNDDIPRGHKIALININKGEYIIKYGEIIGMAIKDIKKGDYVHTHNIDSIRGKIEVS